MIYCQNKFFTKLHIWPWPLTLWPWPKVNFNISLKLIMFASNIHIQSLVHGILPKTFVYKRACLTLTFDLVTLTFGQLQHLNNTYYMYKHHHCAIIGSWYITKARFSQNCIIDLDLWPCDLDLWSTSTSYQYLSYV